MTPELVNTLVAPFVANGLLGTICVALAAWHIRSQNKAEARDLAHKAELAAKDALIKELYDRMVENAMTGYHVIKQNDKTNSALLAALNTRPNA